MTRFIKQLSQVSYSHRPDETFRSFATLAACAVSAGTREEEYLAEAKRWDADAMQRMAELFAVMVDEMESGPRFADLLGQVYMEIASGSKNWGGEYYTPRDITRMMASVIIGDVSKVEKWPIRILEPASGSGAMALAAVEHIVSQGRSPSDVRVTCVDTSRVACDMCLINMTLWGIPADVTHGNSLSLETWGRWRNLFWHMVDGPITAMAAALDLITGGEPSPEPVPAQHDFELQPRLFA